MHNDSQDQEWELLKSELDSGREDRLLREAKSRHEWLKDYSGWTDVAETAHAMEPDDPEKDRLLRALCGDARAQGYTGWHSVLLGVFWPDLRRIHNRKSHWDQDVYRRWSNVTWAYLKAANNLDPATRPHGIARKLFNDTVHHLYEIYRAEWDQQKREAPTDPMVLSDLYDRPAPPPQASPETGHLHDRIMASLIDHMKAGRIGELDYLLILGTRIYGKALSQCAEEAGLAYQAAKKRRQRAESVIREYNSANKISPESLSPFSGLPPLGQ